MKKVLLSVLVLASISTITSCQKSYSCVCVTSYTDDNGDPQTLLVNSPLSEKMKEKQASSSCDATETQMNSVNADLNADPSGPYDDIATICDIE